MRGAHQSKPEMSPRRLQHDGALREAVRQQPQRSRGTGAGGAVEAASAN